MRTDGRDDAGYNGLTTRRQCKEGVGLVIRGNIESRIGKKSMLQLDSLTVVRPLAPQLYPPF